jgi:hypothetical protein
MTVTLTAQEQEFLARSIATIAAAKQSKDKDITKKVDPYQAHKNRQARRWEM